MENELLVGLAVAGSTLVLMAGSLYFFQRHLRKHERGSAPRPPGSTRATLMPARFGSVRDVQLTFYRLALNIPEGDTTAPHAPTVKAITRSIEDALDRPEYLPRRPLLIPKLLRALNDDASTRNNLANIILQDPVLSGDVLKRANSSFYRIWTKPVESLDRALLLLGVDGLKAVVATSVMRPVFNTSTQVGADFSALVWDHSLHCAEAAGLYAEKTGSGDRFSAHLLGLLSALGTIALFRLSLDVHSKFNEAVRPATVLAVLAEHEVTSSILIARRWELADSFIQALEEQLEDPQRKILSPLGTTLRFGRLCGTLALLHRSGGASAEECRNTASDLGMRRQTFDLLWRVLTKSAQAREAAVP